MECKQCLKYNVQYEQCLKYIENYWNKIICFFPNDEKTRIGLPHHYLSPNETYFYNDEFYWDSFFMAIGYLAYEKEENTHLVEGIIDNFAYLQRKYGIIPLRNKLYNLGISQPPFLSTLVLEVYKRTQNKIRLEEWSEIIETELNDYWKDEHHFNKITKLSRYCDHEVTDITAEHESGWDMTSRFENKCLDFLPVDLNSCLYKYEKDLSHIFEILDKKEKSQEYLIKSNKRKEKIQELMWNEDKGFYFDYKIDENKQSNFFSMAGFYPLWAGIAEKEQSKKIISNIKIFERKGGLANTQEINSNERYKQWDYPNGWAPNQLIAIQGIKEYGFYEDAKRIATKWMNLNKQIFEETGAFWEKYDVENLTIGKEGRYPIQKGFGWTNAVFYKLYKEFFDNPKEEN